MEMFVIKIEVQYRVPAFHRQTSGYGMRGRTMIVPACLVALALLVSPAMAEEWTGDCGTFQEAIVGFGGPFDYTDAGDRARHLAIVEERHFTPTISALRHANAAGNIHYTLNRFPNHHRALDAMSRLSRQEGVAQPRNATYTADCYFIRAVRWRPNDPMVRLVYGIHHYRFGRLDEAIEQARIGLALAPENPEIHYNLGLFLVRAGKYAEAREHARKAYDLGYPLDGLRNQLRRAGHWSD